MKKDLIGEIDALLREWQISDLDVITETLFGDECPAGHHRFMTGDHIGIHSEECWEVCGDDDGKLELLFKTYGYELASEAYRQGLSGWLDRNWRLEKFHTLGRELGDLIEWEK